MSQSALIAFKNSDGTFDLYWSHNGADEFYLKPYLEEVASGDRSRTLPDVDAKLPDGTEKSGFKIKDSLKKAVVPQPVRQRVPKRELGNNIDFLAYEGFYLVTDQSVRVYYPMWTYPGILTSLREMFDLEVYNRDKFEHASETEKKKKATPAATISSEDYSPDRFEDLPYRRFFELHHLGIFQTISGTVNNATKKSELESRTLVNPEYVDIIPKTIESIFEPYRVGNGVLINLAWDEGNMSQRLKSINNRASSIQVDVSIRLLNNSDDVPTSVQYKQFEREIIKRAYRHFGIMIYEEQIQPFTELLQTLSETYAPDERLQGKKYRIIDTDGESALLKPTEQYGKIGAINKSKLSDDDVQIVDFTQTPEDFVGVVTHVENGDIVIANIDDSTMPSKVKSIQLLQKIPLLMENVEMIPEFVEDLYNEEISGSAHSDELPSIRTDLSSEHETISDSEINVGEVQVTHDPENIIWEGLEFGKISEQIYGQFQFMPGQPHEVLLCNPQAESFWFGFFFDTPMTGFARYWRSRFGYDYELSSLNSTPEDDNIAQADASTQRDEEPKQVAPSEELDINEEHTMPEDTENDTPFDIGLFEDKELPEKYEHLPTRDELSPEESEIIESLAEKFAKTAYVTEGGTPVAGWEKERLFTGDDKAEALGNAYRWRDEIRDNGAPCEAEYVEPHHHQDGRVYHKIRFTVPEQ